MEKLHLARHTARKHKLLINKGHKHNSMELLFESKDRLFPCHWLWSLDTISSSDDTAFRTTDVHNMTPLASTHIANLGPMHFKGVVPQLNGKWGAQIYEKSQRVWLGTFNTADEAARAYDRAILKCRGSEAVTNCIQATKEHGNRVEGEFLNRHTKEEVVDMLRRHTYEDEFKAYLLSNTARFWRRKIYKEFVDGMEALAPHGQSSQQEIKESRGYGNSENKSCKQADTDVQYSDSSNCLHSSPKTSIIEHTEHLFDKSLTPSDVGKLNRLVIPKQHAVRCFSLGSGNNKKGPMLAFQDSSGKMWRFRYSYWASSHSYVFTKGWSTFVKEKKLKAGSIISFKRSSARDIFNQRRLFIVCKPCRPVTQPIQEPASGPPFSSSDGSSTQSDMCIDQQGHEHDISVCSNNFPARQLLEEPSIGSQCINTASFCASTSQSSIIDMHQAYAHDISMDTDTSNNQTQKHQEISHDIFTHVSTNGGHTTSMHQSCSHPSFISSPLPKHSHGVSSLVQDDHDITRHDQPHACGSSMSNPHLNQQETVGTSMYVKAPILLDLCHQQRNLHQSDGHDELIQSSQMGHSSSSCLSTKKCYHEDNYFGTSTGCKHSSAFRPLTGGLVRVRVFGVDMEPDMITNEAQKVWLMKPMATICDGREKN